MKPLSLTIENLASFKQKTTIDFEGLDVFGISGPTGAGKSTLLDGICFALYGKVPRVGKSCAEMITLGRPSMKASLRFSVGDRVYTVARTLRRKGSAGVQLDEPDSRVEGVREVESRLEHILGMTFETFTKAVLLPQGAFQEFLQASSGERTKLLRGLLRLGIYDKMRERAVEAAREDKHAINEIDTSLGDLADATEERLAELGRGLAGKKAENVDLGQALAAETPALAALQLDRDRTRRLDEAERQRQNSLAQLPEVEAMRAEIDAAERARPVAQATELVKAARKAFEDRGRDRKGKFDAEQRAVDRERNAASILEVAAQELGRLPALQEHLSRLDGVLGLLDPLATDRAALTKSSARLKQLGGAIRGLLVNVAEAEKRVEVQRKKHKEAADALETTTLDETTARKLEAARVEAAKLQEERGKHSVLVSERKQRDRALKKAEKRLEDATTARDNAKLALDQAKALQDKRQKAWDQARQAELVRELHDGLEIDHPCPVCDQIVSKLPKRPRPPREAAEAEFQEASANHEAAREAFAGAKAEFGSAKEQLAEARDRVEELVRQLDELEAAIAKRADKLAAKIGSTVGGEAADPIEKRVSDALTALDDRRREHDRLRRLFDDTRTALTGAIAAFERAGHDLAVKQAEETRASEMRADLQRRIADAEQAIRAVTTHPSPRTERMELHATLQRITSAHDSARQEAANATAALAMASQVRATADEEVARARGELESREAERKRLARESGFASADDAEASFRAERDLANLRARVREHAQNLHSIDSAIAQAQAELGERRVSDEQVRSAELALEAKRERLANGQREEGELGARLVSTQERVKLAGRHRERRVARARSSALNERLAKDLQSGNFQEWLQRASVRELVDGAGIRLRELSRDRYGLQLKGDELYVVDDDNAGEVRVVTTLSGGETFLASLALALELSEQVQRAAGAVRLESLFIDEGFGTLDVEALDVATDAIESLQKGGRMVGVISHVPTLNERLRAQVLVKRDAQGSRVEVVR